MYWYYVKDGKQYGPIDEQTFANLSATGTIHSETLVWRQGLKDWTSFGQLSPLPIARPLSDEGEASACSLCGRTVSPEDFILIDGCRVCSDCKPDFEQRLAEHADMPIPGRRHFAGFWIRAVAYLIDYCILYVINFTLLSLFLIIMLETGWMHDFYSFLAIYLVVVVLYVTIEALYEILLLGAYGATIGKMVCRIRVVNARGNRISYGRATGRYFAKWISNITLGIGYVIAAFDSEKRALHDHICNTRVEIRIPR